MEKGYPRIHGFVYDIGEGLLQRLDVDFKTIIKKYDTQRHSHRHNTFHPHLSLRVTTASAMREIGVLPPPCIAATCRYQLLPLPTLV